MISVRRTFGLLLTAVIAALPAACSDADSSSAEKPVARLDVGIVPVIDVAPLYLGINKGFFAAQRLAVTPKLTSSGSLIVTAVAAGDQQIGFSNNTSLLIGAAKGLPLRLVAAGNQGSEADYAAVFARANSQIRSAADLAGKRVAVNSLNNVGALSVNAALEASGVDISGVRFVEIPFPQMAGALAKGRVDAVWAVEPFVSAIKAEGGARVVLRPYPLIAPHFPVASYFTSRAYAASDADVVRRFREAMNQSLAYAQNHPDEVRKVLPSYIKLSPAVAAKVMLPEWNADLGAPLLQRTADLALKYGYLDKEPDVAQLIDG